MGDLKKIVQLPKVSIPILRGEQGIQGPQGETGSGRSLEFEWDNTSLGVKVEGEENFEFQDLQGENGKTAYEIAVENGYTGTKEEWLLSLRGEKGEKGDGVFNRKTYTYTLSEETSEMVLPEGYKTNQQIDVFINGFKLNANEYSIQEDNSVYKLIFTNTIDVAGTVLEIVLIETMDGKSLENEIADLQGQISEFSEWAKQPQKPTYTAEEVGALPANTELFSGSYKDLRDKPNIPAATSDLENDSGFIDNTVNNLVNYLLKTETYTKEEINALIGAITTMNIQKVDTLPSENISTTTIYFVPKTSAKTQDVYDEYVYINENWEHIGSTEIDLTGYATEEWVNIQIADFLTETDVSTLINSALESYYNKTEIDNELTKRDTKITILKEENEILKNQIPNRTSRRREYNVRG